MTSVPLLGHASLDDIFAWRPAGTVRVRDFLAEVAALAERLPAGKFPAESRADFRLHIAPEVCRGIEQHAKTDVSIEICGVLVEQDAREAVDRPQRRPQIV